MPHAVIGGFIQVSGGGDGKAYFLSGCCRKCLPQAGCRPAQDGRRKAGAVATANGGVRKRKGCLHAQRHDIGLDPAVCRWAPSAEHGVLALRVHGADSQNAVGIGRSRDVVPGRCSAVSRARGAQDALLGRPFRGLTDARRRSIEVVVHVVHGAVVKQAVPQ